MMAFPTGITKNSSVLFDQDGNPVSTVSGSLGMALLVSGTVGLSTQVSGTSAVEGRASDGVVPIGNPVLVSGIAEGFVKTLLLDSLGRVITAPASAISTRAGFIAGETFHTNLGFAALRKNALNEQSSNAQRSIVSTNANDTGAGTGARTVRILYYTSTGTGPFTTTVTMNGTTAVNTSVSDICFVESLEVVTVGSTGGNVGTISLMSATGGGGSAIMQMTATDNVTFYGLHYVPSGSTCFITSLAGNSNSSAIGNSVNILLRAQTLGVANTVDKQVSDRVRIYGQAPNVIRAYPTPIQVPGPARIQLWVTPESANDITTFGSIDFYEQET